MKRSVYLLLTWLVFLLFTPCLNAQDPAKPKEKEKPQEGWKTGAGLGLDFAQLLQINPRQGAGQNRLGFGSAFNFYGNLRKGRLAWDNASIWQFGIQRLGAGVIAQGVTQKKIPFQKAIDELRLNSKIGYQISKKSKFFYAADLSFLSQLTKTYQGNKEYPGNFLTDVAGTGKILSKFFSPATITISIGFDFKPDNSLSFYYSPVGGKFIIVGNDVIASYGVHGNPVEGMPDPTTGRYAEYDNTFAALGSLLRTKYANKFFKDKIAFAASLTLFSNYIKNAQNIDVDWTNELAVQLAKGLQATVTVNVFYDDDVMVQITDYSYPNGIRGLGRRVSLTQQLLLKYNVVF
ncbi:MAG TPA: DUF3078 domain-containing protein [Flavilitoribacter sp.]|nr:DUF3078 domain-containing protein [Flavilitoribacter sp.]